MPDFQETNWYVITGPPCSGKTTLINRLSNLGYTINPDISRAFIISESKNGFNVRRLRKKENEFQKKILSLMLDNALYLDKTEIIFHDYFLPDNIAFLKLSNLEIPVEFAKSAKLFSFKLVFICSPLKFESDDVRIETEHDQLQLFELIKGVYSSLGCKIIILPPTSIDERLNMVKAFL